MTPPAGAREDLGSAHGEERRTAGLEALSYQRIHRIRGRYGLSIESPCRHNVLILCGFRVHFRRNPQSCRVEFETRMRLPALKLAISSGHRTGCPDWREDLMFGERPSRVVTHPK